MEIISRGDAEARRTQRNSELLFEILFFSKEIYDIVHRLIINNVIYRTTKLLIFSAFSAISAPLREIFLILCVSIIFDCES